LAERLYEARRIILLGNDLAVTLVYYLEYQLSALGLPVFSGTSAGRIFHLVRSVNKKDLALAISFRRGLRQTIEGAQQARTRGAYCIGLADTYVSPLSRVCDELFLASIESTSFGPSYAAPISLINAMIAATGQYRRARTLAVVSEIAEEQRKGSRWYTP
jgi:DNA-binding MurR/RpiR family transcriptional regulator